jgi:hypothetical protein
MPRYVISSDSAISARPISKPDFPDWGRPDIGLPGEPEYPDTGGPPLRPGHGLPPMLPPREEWPPLPPFFQPGVGLPIPPTPDFPMVPIPPDEGPSTGGPDEEIGIWPPVRNEWPDLSDKTLALALIFVSRHVAKWHWVVIDHSAAKEAFKKIKDKIPAGGVGGTPPARPTPGQPAR